MSFVEIEPGEIVNRIYTESLPSMIELCLEVGDEPKIFIEQIQNEIRKMVGQMMAEDEALIERKRTELDSARSRFRSLHQDLFPEKICPEFEENFPLLIALKLYLENFEKLQAEHEKLIEKESDIRAEENQLCQQLNEFSLQNDSNNFLNKPLINQMSLLSEHIEFLKREKKNRIEHLSEILRNLNEFELIYGWKRPKSDSLIGQLLELGLTNVEKFDLTNEKISIVEKEFSQINEEIQKAETSFEQSTKELNILMRKHQSLLPNKKILSMSNAKQCRLSKLPQLIAEVDRYKEHSMEKLTKEILRIREEIYSMLTKISADSTRDSSKYAILSTNEFTDDVYFMHEELLRELETQYESNKSIYEQIEIWNEIFVEFQLFEKNSCDPQRFHRRGYSALNEEKTRRKLELNLRESEIRLEKLGEEFSLRNKGQNFLVGGQAVSLSEYIQRRKDEYFKNKERERETNRTPNSKKKARTETIVRVKPAALQSVPASDENHNFSDENQCATTLCVPFSKKKNFPN